jgi:hypothetical protein
MCRKGLPDLRTLSSGVFGGEQRRGSRVATIATWAVACAIDVPGTYINAQLIFGRHPAVPFLLMLAVSADAIGLASLPASRCGRLVPCSRCRSHDCRSRLGGVLPTAGRSEFLAYLLGPGMLS